MVARAPLVPHLQAEATAGPARSGLTDALVARYGSDLAIPLRSDRPTVIANFVTTIDGVISYAVPGAAGGGEISGFSEPDRFVMGLLRSLADVVLIGAGTLRAAPDHRWVPGHVHPASAAEFSDMRRRLGLPSQPMTALVTASGEVDLAHPGLSDRTVPALIVTSDRGAEALRLQRVPVNVEIVTPGAAVPSASSIVRLLAGRGARLVLSEGGPHLIGQLLAAGLVDELFLTTAPQVAGRAPAMPRLGLVEGTAFEIERAPWFDLVDLRRAESHLFSRYRSRGETRGQA